MTKIDITRQGKSIVAVNCSGHTGYEEQGYDIVCAALSSIVQTAALGLLQVVGIDINFRKSDSKGWLNFELPCLDTQQRHDADIVLNTMLFGIDNLHDSYSDFIELTITQRENKNDN